MVKKITFFFVSLLVFLPSCRDDGEEAFLGGQTRSAVADSTVDLYDPVIAEVNALYTPEEWYSYIFKTSSLTGEQKALVLEYLGHLTDNKYDKWYAPLLRLLRFNKIERIYVSSKAPVSAGYDPSTNVIIFKSISAMSESAVTEELLHAGQNRVYPDGISQYGFKGLPNIEFEVRFFRDLIAYIEDRPITPTTGSDNFNEYYFWIEDICKENPLESTFPSVDRVLEIKIDGQGYYDMVQAFRTYLPAYAGLIDYGLKPLYIGFIYNSISHLPSTAEYEVI